MRILICNYEYPPLGGGGGKITYLLSRELAKRHELTVITSHWNNLPREQIEYGIRVIRVPVLFRNNPTSASMLSLASYVPMAIKEGKKFKYNSYFDVINTHFVLPTGPVGHYLSGLYKIPNVLTLHGGDIYDPSKFNSPHRYIFLRVWIRRLLSRANAIVGNSHDTLNNMYRYYDAHNLKNKTIKIPLGVAHSNVDKAPRESYGFSKNDILLVTIGRLIKRKSIIQLIHIMHQINIKFKKVYLIIIGTGPEESMLKRESIKFNLDKKIIFLGNIDDDVKNSVLKMCDIYVSTSQHEGFGLVYLEAMQAGLPIISYDNGGHIEFLKDEKTGFIISKNCMSEFNEKCSWLVNNPEKRINIKNYNLNLVKQYQIEHCCEKYERLFEETIEAYNTK